MKNTSSSRPRFVCRIVRQWSAVAAGGGARHAESCADCQAYFESAAALDSAFRREAGAWAQAMPEPSVGFEHRLLRAVAQPAVSAATKRPWVGYGAWAATAAFAVAVAFVFFRPSSGPTRASNQENAAMLVSAVESVSRGLMETVIPTTGALVARNPMQREFDAIYSDARSALGFLALNFLPASGTAAVPARRS